ncbi:MAG: glycoside hydrolase family 88 protein [Oscillospiraceae bacterium]|nr:glycoside hydrolase family 88 protein [Oscillospiraceae bacterium]MBR3537336.1 glycoside hydrolase family 88 protein [Oscillospiraceae bacterium]MBR6837130.1 glycoside hydrolase family 88 protein [Oscillospiraceae bacterium]
MTIAEYTDRYINNYKNYKDYWNYEDGCILTGCIKLFEATKNRKYCDFVLNYLSSVLSEDGIILNYDHRKHSTDSFNSGRSLLFAWHMTGFNKYRNAIMFLLDKIKEYPRTCDGSFIHKSIYPGQVWLDGLYMLQPFYASCIKEFGDGNFDDIAKQFRNVRKTMYSAAKKLYCHGYDSDRIQPWADSESGCSEGFWLRAIGWYLMALVDTADAIGDTGNDCYRLLTELFCEAASGITGYSDSHSGLFYQVVDHPEDSRNYTETSGSLMISYALMKSVHLGFPVDSAYKDISRNIFSSVLKEKLIDGRSGLTLTDICCSAGLGPGIQRNGSPEYYFSELVVSDDPKGVGAFMMAHAEILNDDRINGGNTYET